MKLFIWHWLTLGWEVLQANSRWMSWNLFLALVPLVISFQIFRPNSWRWFHWCVAFLLGITFLPNLNRVLAYSSHLIRELGLIYVIGIIVITLILMGWDFWPRHHHISRSLRWWFGFLTFIAFLPNAPYVLTDVIHLIDDIRHYDSVWIITLMIIPQYLLFMVLGFQAYVLSLINLGRYLNQWGWGQFTPWAEWMIHGLSAIGIYLGRFQRFNSWDILTNPDVLVSSMINDLVGKRPALVMLITFVVISSLYWLFKQITLGMMQRQQLKTIPQESLAPAP